MKTTSKLFGLVSSVAFAMLFFSANAKATTYTLSGNTTYDLGVLPEGDSSLSVTDVAYIPFHDSNHSTGDSFNFSLAVDSFIGVSFVSGIHTAAEVMNLCSSTFCYATGVSNVSAFLAAGDYALGVIALIPAAPPDTPPYFSETYGADIVVGVSATPLPSTWLMMLGGLVCLGFFANRGTKRNAATPAA